MRRISLIAILFLSVLGIFSCGSSERVPVDIDLAVNQSVNPFQTIQSGIDAGTSRGLYFQFQPLNAPPSGIEDLQPTGVLQSFPEQTQAGRSPENNSFDVDTSDLDKNTYYRVSVIALDISGNRTHEGVADCPLLISLGSCNNVTVCFGVVGTTPLCPESDAFTFCPLTPADCP